MTTPLPVLPRIIVEAGLLPDAPVQGGTTIFLNTGPGLNTGTLGTSTGWTDISQWVISFTITRPSTRQQGPLFTFQAATASIVLDNSDGRFDPDNLAGPYAQAGVTQLTAMAPVRVRAIFSAVAYGLYSGFADGWLPGQVTYEGGYAEITLPATDAFRVLAGITLPAVALEGAGADTGARVRDILTRAGWYSSGDRSVVSTGNSTLQGTTLGDTALNLMQIGADSEIGQLYQNGSGAIVFRARHDLLTDARSSTMQAVFGDLPGTLHFPGARPSSQGNSFEGGTDGAAVTTAASGGISGQPFAAVTVSGGGTVTWSAAHAAHGLLSAACATTASASAANVSYATGSHPQLWARLCMYLTANPAANDQVLTFTDAGGTLLAGAGVSITGQLFLFNRFGGGGPAFATTLPLNQWVMVTVTAMFPQTATAAMTAQLYLNPDGSPFETQSFSGADFGTTPVANAVFGPSAGVASNFTAWIDDVEVNNDGPSGPAGLAPLPELAYAAVTRASDDTTIANDVQATRLGGTLQEVKDTASIAKYLFPRTYPRADLILQDDTTALNWAQWVLYISKGGEDRFESVQADPQADTASLWPQVLGREIGDRIQVVQRPAGVAVPVVKDCFIAGIVHAWDSVTSAWLTTWTLQDASKYGSFLTLNNATLGQLGSNALTFLVSVLERKLEGGS